MRGLSFLVDGEYFAVDVTRVQKVVRKIMVTPVPTALDVIAGITNLKGRTVTVFNLYKSLDRDGNPEISNAVIFKPLSGGEDQIGLLIDKTEALVDIDDETVRLPSLAAGTEESFCISGIAEIEDRLYRIIDIDAVANGY